MGQVAEAWLECQKRIDDYVDEQVSMQYLFVVVILMQNVQFRAGVSNLFHTDG